MPREFVDSFGPLTKAELSVALNLAFQFGYTEIWLSNAKKQDFIQIEQSPYPKPARIYTRLDLGGADTTKDQLIPILRQERRQVPIIAVCCHTAELTSWAAQDNRVDILTFPFQAIGKLFTRSVAKLMIKFQKTLEVPLASLYTQHERGQIGLLRQVRAALTIAQHKEVPIIFTSGSYRAFHVRPPRELVALGQVLLNRSTEPLDAVSTLPNLLRETNQRKISPQYISPGVYKHTEDEGSSTISEDVFHG